MDITKVAAEKRAKLAGVSGLLADMVREGRLSPRQFLAAQERVYRAYVAASED